MDTPLDSAINVTYGRADCSRVIPGQLRHGIEKYSPYCYEADTSWDDIVSDGNLGKYNTIYPNIECFVTAEMEDSFGRFLGKKYPVLQKLDYRYGEPNTLIVIEGKYYIGSPVLIGWPYQEIGFFDESLHTYQRLITHNEDLDKGVLRDCTVSPEQLFVYIVREANLQDTTKTAIENMYPEAYS